MMGWKDLVLISHVKLQGCTCLNHCKRISSKYLREKNTCHYLVQLWSTSLILHVSVSLAQGVMRLKQILHQVIIAILGFTTFSQYAVCVDIYCFFLYITIYTYFYKWISTLVQDPLHHQQNGGTEYTFEYGICPGLMRGPSKSWWWQWWWWWWWWWWWLLSLERAEGNMSWILLTTTIWSIWMP